MIPSHTLSPRLKDQSSQQPDLTTKLQEIRHTSKESIRRPPTSDYFRLWLQAVIVEVGHNMAATTQSDRPITSQTKVALLLLRLLAKHETFRQVADRFDTGTW